MVGKPISLLMLLIVAVALTVSGCGGDDTTSGGSANGGQSSAELTKSEFLHKGLYICHKNRQERMRSLREAEPKEKEYIQAIVEFSLPPYQETIDELTELTPPAEDAEEVERMISLMEKAAASVEANLVKATPDIEAANDAVIAYGLHECKF